MKRAYVKEKVCRNKDCRRKFKPYRSTQVACSHKCAVIIQKVHCVIKRRVDIIPVSGRDKIGDLREKLQVIINELVRIIDKGLPCISCVGTKLPQAGHFHPVGAKPYLRFNLNNIHVQDHRCNIELTGNQEQYFKGLCDRYGAGYASWVENILPARFRNVKLSKPELKEAIVSARECLAEIKNRTIPIESMQERLKIRLIYNNRIGIYKTY